MKLVLITPCKEYLLAEILEKASENLNTIIRNTPWLKWKQMWDVNGKGRMQWYIVVDTTLNKEERLKYFAKLVCEIEHYEPSSRICPHDLYYEDFEKYFEVYRK